MRSVEPDPSDEYFDVVDAEGNPTGEVKSRYAVHRDGDWHRAFHCWVVLYLEDGSPAIVFQRRSASKDTYPEKLDVSVGGHYRAGEGFDDVVREIEEELGIAPATSDLIHIGRRRAVGRGETTIDREIEDLYVHCLEVPIESLRPSYEEVTALDVVRLTEMEVLFGGTRERVESLRFHVRADNTLMPGEAALVSTNDFVGGVNEYWLLGSRAAAQVLEGCSGARLDLWPLNDR